MFAPGTSTLSVSGNQNLRLTEMETYSSSGFRFFKEPPRVLGRLNTNLCLLA